MKTQLIGTQIVILAENHNPTIASTDWLLEKGIVQRRPVNFVHLPVLSRFEAESYAILVEENRWQIEGKSANPVLLEELPEIARKYVEALPETVYTAVGLNSDWRLTLEDISFVEKINSLFLCKDGPIEKLCQSEKEFQVSGTLRFKRKDFLVQVNTFPDSDQEKEGTIRFNWHSLITKKVERANGVKEGLNCFSETLDQSEELLKIIFS